MYNAEDFRVRSARQPVHQLAQRMNHSFPLKNVVQAPSRHGYAPSPNYGNQRYARHQVQTGAPACCAANVYDFNLFPGVQFTKLANSQVIANSKLAAKITAYGYTNSNVATPLSTRGNQGVGEQGMGIWDDQFSNVVPDSSIHEIDNQHYVQLDVTALKPYQTDQCGGPTITIGSEQVNEGFEIGGSNVQGQFGTQLFTYISTSSTVITKTISLFNPAGAANPTLYNFISVRAFPSGAVTKGGDAILINVTVNTCPTTCQFGSADCAGVCGGKSVLDCAGVCYNPTTGGKPTKVVDCNGVCGGPAVADCKGVCGGTTTYDCAGTCGGTKVPDCSGACGGNKVPDCKGVCGGTAQTDCAGVCAGTSTYDCGGNCYDQKQVPPPKTKDCAGVCGGTAYPDACGKCVTPDCVWDQGLTVHGYRQQARNQVHASRASSAAYNVPSNYQVKTGSRPNRFLPKNV